MSAIFVGSNPLSLNPNIPQIILPISNRVIRWLPPRLSSPVNVLPANFEDGEPQVMYAVLLMLAGFALIFVLEQAAIKLKK